MTSAERASTAITRIGGDYADILDVLSAIMKIDSSAKAHCDKATNKLTIQFSDGSELIKLSDGTELIKTGTTH